MSILLNCTKNECRKLLKRKKYIVFLLIEIFVCLLFMLIQTAFNKALDGEISFKFKNMSMSMLDFFIQGYIPLIIFMASCDLFATEMQDVSIKAVLLRPISRFKVFMSKTLAVGIFATTYLVTLFLVTNILEAVSNGGIANFWFSFGAYLLDIIPVLILVLMAVLINQITKSGSLAMFLCMLIFIVLCIIGIFLPSSSGLLFTGYLQWHKIWLGATLPFGAILAKIGLLGGYGLVFGCTGFYLFDRRDF